MNFKNKTHYSKKITDKMEISDANVLMRLVIEEKSVVMSTELKLACLSVSQPGGPGGGTPPKLGSQENSWLRR